MSSLYGPQKMLLPRQTHSTSKYRGYLFIRSLAETKSNAEMEKPKKSDMLQTFHTKWRIPLPLLFDIFSSAQKGSVKNGPFFSSFLFWMGVSVICILCCVGGTTLAASVVNSSMAVRENEQEIGKESESFSWVGIFCCQFCRLLMLIKLSSGNYYSLLLRWM